MPDHGDGGAASARRLQIDWLDGEAVRERMRFNREVGQVIKIGRLSSAHFCFDDPRVAFQHALIEFAPEAIYIVDLGSPQGTLLNGAPVAGRAALTDGDRIAIGPYTLAVCLDP